MKIGKSAKKTTAVMKQLSLCVVVRLTNTKPMAAQAGADRTEMYEGCRRRLKEICKVNKEFCM